MQGACHRTTPYDGFALSNIKAGSTVHIELHAFGQAQPAFKVSPRLIFQLVIALRNGKQLTLSTGDPSGNWVAFDADCASCSLYNPAGNSGGRFGAGYWYYYPYENTQAKCLPREFEWNARIWPALSSSALYMFEAPLEPKATLPVSVEQIALTSLELASKGLWLFTAASEVMGGLNLKVANASKFHGAVARISLFEQLKPGSDRPLVPMYTGATFTSNFTLLPGAQLEHHEYANFRFGEIAFVDANGAAIEVTKEDFTLRVWYVHYPFDKKTATAFSLSSAALDSVWKLNLNSVDKLGLDMYSDSNAESATLGAKPTSPPRARRSTLRLPSLQCRGWRCSWIFPSRPSARPESGRQRTASATWADWTVLPAINVVNYALFTGDLKIGHGRYSVQNSNSSSSFTSPTPKQIVAMLVSGHLYAHMINKTGTLGAGLVVDKYVCVPHRTGVGRWKNPSTGQFSCLSALIDTSGGSDDGFVQSHVNSVANAWAFYGHTQVARLAGWLGEHELQAQLSATAATLKAAFNKLMVDPQSGVVCDSLCSLHNHSSLHSSAYALAFGLVDVDTMPKTFAHVASSLERNPRGWVGGPYPIQFLLLGLLNYEPDRGNVGVSVLTDDRKHSWRAMMAAHNATTTMEGWAADELPNLSYSHIWSASPAFIIPWRLGGIQPTLPGFAKVEIKPQPGPLQHFPTDDAVDQGPNLHQRDAGFRGARHQRRHAWRRRGGVRAAALRAAALRAGGQRAWAGGGGASTRPSAAAVASGAWCWTARACKGR